MLKSTLFHLTILLLFVSLSYAQNQSSKLNETAEKKVVTGNENVVHDESNVVQRENIAIQPVKRGGLTFNFSNSGVLTGYDLQSNSSPQQVSQVLGEPDFVHYIMTNSQQSSGWTDRTTAYAISLDGGQTILPVANVPTTGESSGFPAVASFEDGRGVVSMHSGVGGVATRSLIYVDSEFGGGTFTLHDPGLNPDAAGAIWPRVAAFGDEDVVLAASVNGGIGAWTNVLNTTAGFAGWEQYDGDQAETYSLAYSRSGSVVGHLFQGTGDDESGVFYRESLDGGESWSEAFQLWEWDDQGDSLGNLRGLSLAFLDETPVATFEISKLGAGSYFPSFPAWIYFWSPDVNGGLPVAIADSNNVPYFEQFNDANDVFTVLARPSIGVSEEGSAIFVTFNSTTENVQEVGGLANTYMAGWFTYSLDGGETWEDPVKFTPESPVLDWRYISVSKLNAMLPERQEMTCRVQMLVQADINAGSTVNAPAGFPVGVTAEMVGVTVEILVPVTSVDDLTPIVNSFDLAQNYPNPFNPSTTIKYSVAERSNVSIKIYDMLGKEIATLVNNVKEAGSYEVNFDASNMASGMYVYSITAGNFTASKKMMLLK